jgi:hypothetical protein
VIAGKTFGFWDIWRVSSAFCHYSDACGSGGSGIVSGYAFGLLRLSDASVRLLVGGFVAVTGVLLLLVGFFSAKREARSRYY